MPSLWRRGRAAAFRARLSHVLAPLVHPSVQPVYHRHCMRDRHRIHHHVRHPFCRAHCISFGIPDCMSLCHSWDIYLPRQRQHRYPPRSLPHLHGQMTPLMPPNRTDQEQLHSAQIGDLTPNPKSNAFSTPNSTYDSSRYSTSNSIAYSSMHSNPTRQATAFQSAAVCPSPIPVAGPLGASNLDIRAAPHRRKAHSCPSAFASIRVHSRLNPLLRSPQSARRVLGPRGLFDRSGSPRSCGRRTAHLWECGCPFDLAFGSVAPSSALRCWHRARRQTHQRRRLRVP
jgi:hypothetical protein